MDNYKVQKLQQMSNAHELLIAEMTLLAVEALSRSCLLKSSETICLQNGTRLVEALVPTVCLQGFNFYEVIGEAYFACY